MDDARVSAAALAEAEWAMFEVIRAMDRWTI
jgi:hypothetical protein